ncbi:MAG TPA: YtxH domain-containing protein [Patescibacteria group bacterium]|nr:YtxH domain-containing protein [Patescibacteria group bacterium]
MTEMKGSPDNSLGSFMFGLTIGVLGALLLGTEDGRKTAKKLLHSMSEGLEKNEDLFQEAKDIVSHTVSQIGSRETPSENLPDQPTGFNEYPPPPPPLTNRPARTPTYFTSGGESLLP